MSILWENGGCGTQNVHVTAHDTGHFLLSSLSRGPHITTAASIHLTRVQAEQLVADLSTALDATAPEPEHIPPPPSDDVPEEDLHPSRLGR